MPYISPKRKDEIASDAAWPLRAGDLTYLLYKGSLESWEDTDGGVWGGPSLPYSVLHARYEFAIQRYLPEFPRYEYFAIVLGCLDSTARELERRHPQDTINARRAIELFAQRFYYEQVAHYEDTKIEENGDVVCD